MDFSPKYRTEICIEQFCPFCGVVPDSTYRIHFVPYVFDKFCLVLKKASNVSRYSFLTVSFYSITSTRVT